MGLLLAWATAVRCGLDLEDLKSLAAPLAVSPTVVTGSGQQNIYNNSNGFSSTLHAFTGTCQLNFSYVSNQPVSVWLSVENQAQALLVLPSGRPCINQTFCSASLNVEPRRTYFLLAENRFDKDARVTYNFSAAVSSAAGGTVSVAACK